MSAFASRRREINIIRVQDGKSVKFILSYFSGTFPMATAATVVRKLLEKSLGTRDKSREKNVPLPHNKQYLHFFLIYH